MKRTIIVALAMQSEKARLHLQGLLTPLIANVNSKGLFPPILLQDLTDVANAPQGLFRHLESVLSKDQACMVVLIADFLVTPGTQREPTPVTAEWLDKFRYRPFATVAVMANPCRVADIDRSVAPDAKERALAEALDLVFHRLEYLSPPETPLVLDPSKLTVRSLRNGNLTEFKDYFALRHRIYKVMGYLEEEVETCRSQLEMNEADTHAVHIGAFYRLRFKEVLIGCARVVMNTSEDSGLREVCESLAGNDPIILRRLDRADGLNLPIFQTHRGMNRIMREIYRNNLTCGELSRVVVEREYRGSGLSRRLVEAGISRAGDLSVTRLFLECLEIHEPLYRKLGFVKLEGMKGRVVTVARTMIAMEMPTAAPANTAAARRGHTTRFLPPRDPALPRTATPETRTAPPAN